MNRVIILFLIAILFFSCNHSKTKTNKEKAKETYTYFFAGHIYRWYTHDKVDKRIENLDYSQFDQVWLGGDVCSHLTEKKETLSYIDSIFDLKSDKVHWTWGNHDVLHGHHEWITEKTGKDLYYASNFNGITLLNLNTNMDSVFKSDQDKFCLETQKQYQLIKNVCDSITKSSHLIILTHNISWHNYAKNANTYANLFKNTGFSCDVNQTFDSIVYPHLKKVQEKGIQVIGIAGDSGLWGKYGHYTDENGILYLACGINNSKLDHESIPEEKKQQAPKDKVLLLKHKPKEKQINFYFADLDSLYESQSGKQ
ncbi:MAG: hypothetical protein C0594_10925 [Marinilabiliales bacterium]|nr:MAG: hypothetical protein C0594_10925 [Marinilabiliales bacterium]